MKKIIAVRPARKVSLEKGEWETAGHRRLFGYEIEFVDPRLVSESWHEKFRSLEGWKPARRKSVIIL